MLRTLDRFGPAELVEVVEVYRDALRSHQAAINRLNVYPVPDGDTGTNMALTLESVVSALEGHRDDGMEAVTAALGHGSLMGARGNSGVILSQILRGLASVIGRSGRLDGAVLAQALTQASLEAYAAVQKPVEGTILTVARAAAEAATAAAGGSLVEVLEAARACAAEALERTPELLAVLQAAGVVDAGGAGLILLFDAFLHVADGRPMPSPPEGDDRLPAGLGAGDAREAEGLRYEVMYLLEAPDETIPAFRDVWAGIGDSIVVVGGDGLWNCHIHTGDIGPAVEAALEAGRPRDIRVTDLWEQVEEERWVREAAGGEPALPETPVNCAVVAVCTGAGIRRIFGSLGVHHTVSGGQSMNPSTADILAAIDSMPAGEVILLPNNKNIIPVAEAAARESNKTVRVVPTRGIPDGFAALLEYDPEETAEGNMAAMMASAARVVAGEVTQAVRDSVWDLGPIAAGDYLGLSREGIEVVSPTLAGAATGLLERLIDEDHHEIVTLIAGEGSSAADTRRITQWLEQNRPGVGAEVHQGGQPLYPYLIGVE
ncbi:MAG: DAK2 domain-containing protein [Acidimicrobiales bacterium]